MSRESGSRDCAGWFGAQTGGACRVFSLNERAQQGCLCRKPEILASTEAILE